MSFAGLSLGLLPGENTCAVVFRTDHSAQIILPKVTPIGYRTAVPTHVLLQLAYSNRSAIQNGTQFSCGVLNLSFGSMDLLYMLTRSETSARFEYQSTSSRLQCPGHRTVFVQIFGQKGHLSWSQCVDKKSANLVSVSASACPCSRTVASHSHSKSIHRPQETGFRRVFWHVVGLSTFGV